MNFLDRVAVFLATLVFWISRLLRFGAGGTWPGEIALMLRPNIASALVKNLRKGVILIAGTNGKTTTSLMVTKILEQQGFDVVHNASGANLFNGIVSSLIQKSRADWGVFEVDENSLPQVIKFIKFIKLKVIVVLLNLFRDQLDRYGEVDVIIEKWEQSLKNLNAIFILNADDPGITYLGKKVQGRVIYFGVNDKKYFLKGVEHATDSTFCLNCGGRLTYEGIYYSHIGIWRCEKCGFARPKPTITSVFSPLPGLYNQYNALAAHSVAKILKIAADLSGFDPAFGRQEEFIVEGKKVKIFLSKNPAGFNASLRSALELGAKQFLFLLNDRIPDGRDVSWIWDVDFEMIPKNTEIFVSGDRVYDLALRLQYSGKKTAVVTSVYEAIKENKTLFILATYSAMLEVRKALLGRKIL